MMIQCAECGAHISSEAKACPHCGKPTTPKTDSTTNIVAIIAMCITVMFMMAGFFWAMTRM